MADKIRLKIVLTKFNISLQRVVDFLHAQGIEIESNPNGKVDEAVYQLLVKEFRSDKEIRDASEKIFLQKKKEKEQIREELLRSKAKEKDLPEPELIRAKADEIIGPKTLGKIDLQALKYENRFPKKTERKTISTSTPFQEKKNISSSIQGPTKTIYTKVVQQDISQSNEEKLAPVPHIIISKPIVAQEEPQHIKTEYRKLSGLMLTGDKIDLSQFERKKSTTFFDDHKKKRKRIKKEITLEETKGITSRKQESPSVSTTPSTKKTTQGPLGPKVITHQKSKRRTSGTVLTDEQIGKQIKETLEKLSSRGGKSRASKLRKEKRQSRREKVALQSEINEEQSKILKVAEFATVNELAAMMHVPETKLILTCMSLGIMATMNQRLDAETITLVADEFGYSIEFVGADLQESIQEEKDEEEDLKPRPPVVTIMGHVDHGKTSLLDYIRNANVIAGEAGSITQHIGAYSVTLEKGQHITFLDTPGHEAFTAMRARGAQITDVVIIVVAADDQIMPQTKEAISHAQVAGVPMIFALNKVDKPTAQPDKIREQLASMNLLVEEWGGKYQSQEISAKTGTGVNQLLKKILLEAEMLDLKANSEKPALGTIIEATLDKGRGYVTTILIQGGTLKTSDYVLAGSHHGKVKIILDERGKPIPEAGPSQPVIILGLSGAPTAGDKFKVFKDEKEAKQLASRREQLQREQNIRAQKHLTLDEIGRRIALGNFKELKIILKGDVDGSVEALLDALQKLSTNSIVVNIIYKGVGQITESDVLLAGTSDAIIIGFNVRPAIGARNIAEKEDIEIRTYSIIYDAINDVKEAMEGLLSPEVREQILGSAEVREVFKITKVGTVAGCMVTEGKMVRHAKIRLIREGIVIHDGELDSLKRFKDDTKEVTKGYECGLGIKNYNDIRISDVIEAYGEVTVNRML
ncbi:MAG: translation initiation factor IF-2 [Flavobacteriales bacterium AspAUS03]